MKLPAGLVGAGAPRYDFYANEHLVDPPSATFGRDVAQGQSPMQ